MNKILSKVAYVIAESKKKENKSITRMIYDIINYAARLGLSPGEYFTYGLHSKATDHARCMTYMPNAVHFKHHLNKLNTYGREVLFDKLLFKHNMQLSQIPTPETIGYAGPAVREELDFRLLSELTIHDSLLEGKVERFIIKPARGTQGRGIFPVGYQYKNERPFSVRGLQLSTSDFFNFMKLNCENLDRGYVILEKIVPAVGPLKKISPDASPNIRIITLRLPNGDIHVTSASMRLGRTNAATSNAGSGGLLAQIDLDSGTITRCRTNGYSDGEFISTHPDTKQTIVGTSIPQWDKVISLCKEAAKAIDSVNSIGWDVLLDDSGPKVLEGNDDWCVISEQIFGEGYLTSKTRDLLSTYSTEFPAHKMPAPKIDNFTLSFFGVKNQSR